MAVDDLRGNTFASGQLIGSESKVRQGRRGGAVSEMHRQRRGARGQFANATTCEAGKNPEPVSRQKESKYVPPCPPLVHTRGIIIVNVVEITPFVPPSSTDCGGMKSAVGPRGYSFNATLGCVEVPWNYPSLNFVICNSIKLVICL